MIDRRSSMIDARRLVITEDRPSTNDDRPSTIDRSRRGVEFLRRQEVLIKVPVLELDNPRGFLFHERLNECEPIRTFHENYELFAIGERFNRRLYVIPAGITDSFRTMDLKLLNVCGTEGGDVTQNIVVR